MLALAYNQTKSNKKLKKKGSEGLSSKVVQKKQPKTQVVMMLIQYTLYDWSPIPLIWI